MTINPTRGWLLHSKVDNYIPSKGKWIQKIKNLNSAIATRIHFYSIKISEFLESIVYIKYIKQDWGTTEILFF